MPNTIEIDGVIGFDVLPSDISAQLKKFKGKPVNILFSSPGGIISDGLAIFNHIHDYKGETTAVIIGMAASMASYIPLAADKVIAKSNAVMMIHDPLIFTYGNQREHEKAAKILGGFANMLSDIYAKKTGKSLEEIRAIMDEESFFFGSEMLDAGLVDEIDDIEINTKGKDDTVLDAMLKFEIAAEKIKTRPEDYSKIAAYFNTTEKHNNDFFSTPGRPAFSNIQNGERMDINQLKADHPDVYQAVLKNGGDERETATKQTFLDQGKNMGQIEERKRSAEIKALALPGQDELTAKMIEDGTPAAEAAGKFLADQKAKLKAHQDSIEGDLADPLAPDTPDTPSEPEADAKNPVTDYNAAVVKAQDGGKVSKGAAMKIVKIENPELHASFIEASNQGGK